MFSSVANIPSTASILPIIDSNEHLGIGVRLKNHEIVIGQDKISYSTSQGQVDKTLFEPLEEPIRELFYVDKYNNRIKPLPHPDIIKQIKDGRGVIYGMGSFWTSIIPSLVLSGIGEAVASLGCPKIFLMNCCSDRETEGMTAMNYIDHLTASLNRYGELNNPPHSYITHLFVVENTLIPVEEDKIRRMGIEIQRISKDDHDYLEMSNQKHPVYSPDALIHAIDVSIKNCKNL